MKYIFLVLSIFLFSSCRLTYYYPANSNNVERVLGVTSVGDTIQVPVDYFGDRTSSDYDFNLEYFFWRNNWMRYDPTIYNRGWFYNTWWWNPHTPIVIQNTRPRYTPPRKIQRRTPQVQPNRGRSNQTRQPKYVRPSNTRTQSTPTRSNSSTRTTSSGKVIKQ